LCPVLRYNRDVTVKEKRPVKWVRPSECSDLAGWFSHTWNLRAGWEGPYVMLRELGTRFLGFEWVKIVRITSEDEGY
jgi:hypothetical protein